MINNMMLAADFSVLKPDFGLLFWTTVFFLAFWFLISKYAFKPITNALKKREHDIQDALDEATRAREEMSRLKAENDQILAEAREERAKMIKEANEMKNSIINEAKIKAKSNAQTIVTNAKLEIENEKKNALAEVKSQVGNLALEIAEKVLKKELVGAPEHETYVKALVDDVNWN